jgi:hypothetical protein
MKTNVRKNLIFSIKEGLYTVKYILGNHCLPKTIYSVDYQHMYAESNYCQ